jgi:hypothetical protein
MRSERGQAGVEWIGIVLLVALALVALARLAPRADGRGAGATLVHAITCAARDGCERRRSARRPRRSFTVPFLVPPGETRGRPQRPRAPGSRRSLPRLSGRIGGERLRRGVGLAWRRAWFGCLAYERFRYGFLHPESRFPGHAIPRAELLRIGNDCISPVDLVRDWPLLRGR